MAGLDANGLTIKTQPQIQAEIEVLQRTNVSPTLDQGADSFAGNINGVVSDELASLWELARDINDSFSPNFGSGYSLSQLMQITRTFRRDPTYSAVPAIVNVDPGTYAPGSLVAMVDGRPTDRFANVETVENVGGSPTNIAAVFRAESSGPVAAPAGSLVVAEMVSGWNSITTTEDARLGLSVEQDQEARARRESELAQGSSTVDAVRARILRELSDEGVLTCRVLNNDLDTVVDSMPPHSIECIVFGPPSPTTDDNIRLAEVIRRAKGDGIQAYGQTFTTMVADEQGNLSSIGLTRPEPVDIYVALTLIVNDSYPGDTAVVEAILGLERILGPGDAVSFFKLGCAVLDVQGVVDIDSGGIGTTPSVAPVGIPIGIRQYADFDSSRIVINTISA